MPTQHATLSNLTSFRAQSPQTQQIPLLRCFRARQIVTRTLADASAGRPAVSFWFLSAQSMRGYLVVLMDHLLSVRSSRRTLTSTEDPTSPTGPTGPMGRAARRVSAPSPSARLPRR
jgi:hypothetical protein